MMVLRMVPMIILKNSQEKIKAIKQLNFIEFAYYNQKIDRSRYEEELEDVMNKYKDMSGRIPDFDFEAFFKVFPTK